MLTSEWAEVPLGALCSMLSGGTPPKSVAEYWNGSVPWISGATMHSQRISDSERRVTPAAIANGTRLAPLGSTLVLVRGMALLQEIRIGHVISPVAFNQDVKALVPNEDLVDPSFLTYALLAKRPRLLSEVHLAGHGTGVLATDRLSVLPIALPSLDEQRRIAGVLGALDDLIEVNRGLVSDLDASVRLLGLEAMLRAQGRPLVPLTEIAEVAKGYSYKSSELIAGDGWLVNLKNIGRSGTFAARGFKPLTATVKPHQIIDNGDVLVAQTDLTQDREVIARPVRVRKGTLEGRLVASLDLAIVRPKAPHTNESIFAILNTEDFRSHALGYCNGTTVLHMGARALPDYAAPSLTQSEIKALTARVRPLREAADDLNIEISNLEATRDELLPLLMSGRVRVAEEVAA